MTVRSLISVHRLRYFRFCNVLHIWTIRAIPTYRVYRLYDRVYRLYDYYVKFNYADIHIYDAVENITEVKIGTQTEDNPAYGARNDNIELETCAAYTTGPKIDTAEMENNPAYGTCNDNIDLETCPAYTTGPKIDTAQMKENPAYGTLYMQ